MNHILLVHHFAYRANLNRQPFLLPGGLQREATSDPTSRSSSTRTRTPRLAASSRAPYSGTRADIPYIAIFSVSPGAARKIVSSARFVMVSGTRLVLPEAVRKNNAAPDFVPRNHPGHGPSRARGSRTR